MSKKELFLRRVLPLLVLLAGGALAYWLIATQPRPQRAEAKASGLLVETIAVAKTSERLNVTAQGTVVPARRLNVLPQVSGQVQTVNPALKPGNILREGERIITIDPADFKLGVAQRASELKQARAQLALEQGRQSVAEDEWALFKEEFGEGELGATAAQPGLALRQPQLASARAQVERAEAALQQARLQLQRTRIDAPFHAMVVTESASEGQFVQPQQSIAELVGADRFWVRVSVAPDKIPFINIPFGEDQQGSPVEVLLDLGVEQVRFDGYVSRLEGRLDERSRMAQLIVTIPNPLGLLTEDGAQKAAQETSKMTQNVQKFPLLLNAYVDVVIHGQQVVDVYPVPRRALHGGNKVHVYDDGQLRIRSLDIVWERQDAVLARAGLQEGDRLIVSNIAAPVEGMRLRLAADEAPK
jgi:RND family efflux transporter MFP subunit